MTHLGRIRYYSEISLTQASRSFYSSRALSLQLPQQVNATTPVQNARLASQKDAFILAEDLFARKNRSFEVPEKRRVPFTGIFVLRQTNSLPARTLERR